MNAMHMQRVPADRRLGVTLAAGEWNVVLQCLAKAPYEMVAGLIGDMQAQLRLGAAGASGPGLDPGSGVREQVEPNPLLPIPPDVQTNGERHG